MPTYQYKCSDCGYEFELFQYMTDEPVAKCPKCTGKVERLISGGSGLLFKGSGFYITDHRSESYMKAAKADNPKKTDNTEKPKKPSPESSRKATADT